MSVGSVWNELDVVLMFLYSFSSPPLMHQVVGKPESQSRVVMGVVGSLHSDMVPVAQSLSGRQLRVLVRVIPDVATEIMQAWV